MEQNNEKKMTSYDRKRLAREAAAKREKRKNTLSTVAAVVIVACIAALLIFVPMIQNKETNEYFFINDEAVSAAEFNYHRTNLINSNAQFLSLLGISTAEALETTVYDENTGTTYAEFFANRTAESIKDNKALIADAKKKGIDLDVNTEYKTYMEQMKTEAEASEMDLDSYLMTFYGANEKQLKNIIKDSLTATLYSEQLMETYASSDEDAQAEYDANKKEYDSVDYRILDFPAALDDVTSEEDIKTALDAAKAKAQEMMDKVNAGEDFETLCATYAEEDERANYANTETDLSLEEGATYAYTSEDFNDWLFDEARTDGESTIYTDEVNNVHYLILFEKRYMGEDVLENIKETLTYTAVSEYITEISAGYTISDPNDNIPEI